MATTDFNPSNKINVSGPLTPTTTDTPLDIRTRVDAVEDIAEIPGAFVGMLVYCKEDEKTYIVKTLKSATFGTRTIEDYYPDTWEEIATGSISGDTAERIINFLKGLTVGADGTYGIDKNGVATLASIHSPGNDRSMLTGNGWEIDADGNMYVNSIEVRTSLKTLELVFNRLTAEESDHVFTESGLIKTVTPTGNSFLCTIDKRSDNDFHAFQVDDILRGVVNNLASGQGTYYTVWLRVAQIDTTANTILVTKFAGSQCPGGVNYDPEPNMVVHRWGNVTNAARRSCWYISSMEKRIVMLDNVMAPTINENNYAAFFGLPFNISSFKGHTLNPNQPYLYCRGAFLQDLHYIDYKGNVIKTERQRGEWSAATAISNDPYVVTETTYDTVYHNNAKWECLVSNTVLEPSDTNSSAWKMLMKGGKDGEDGTFYYLVPSATTIMRDGSGTPRTNYVSCVVQKCVGEDVTTEQPDNLYYAINGGDLVQGSFVSLSKDDGVEFVEFMLMPETTGAVGMALGEAVLDSPIAKVTVSIIQEPKDGENIPLRLSMWNNSATYHSGNNGEVIQDIVTVDGVTNEMYICKYTHSGVKPSADTCANNNWDATHPWAATEYREFMATKVFFANRALIDNLSITGTITEECENMDMSERVYFVGGEIQDGDATKISSVNVDASGVIAGSIIQLPTYNGYSETGISFGAKAYKVAGTRMSIFTSPANAVLNWQELDPTAAGHDQYLQDILSHSVLVCADPLALIGEAHVEGTTKVIRPKHDWGGGATPYGGTYKHGRFALNGQTARFMFLYPGQHVDLISQVQKIGGDECLVWNICNPSDFEKAGITLAVRGTGLNDFISAGYTLYDYTHSAKGHNISGSGASYLDCFIANLMPFDTRATPTPEDPLIELSIDLSGTYSATGITTVTNDLPTWTAEII